MHVDMTDYFIQLLSQQAMLYDLTYMSGRKESAECIAQFFMRMQELLPVNVTLELGAHEATFSRAVKTTYPERIVRAYEANPHVYSHFLLKGDIHHTGVDYICCAVGDRNGEAEFYVYDRIAGIDEACDSRRQSLLTRLDDDSHCSSVRVPIARLDTLCQHDAEDARYALWIDVEGASRQGSGGSRKDSRKNTHSDDRVGIGPEI